MWRYVAQFFLFFNKMWWRNNLILLAPLCDTLQHIFTPFFVAPGGATIRHHSPSGAKVTNECVLLYLVTIENQINITELRFKS